MLIKQANLGVGEERKKKKEVEPLQACCVLFVRSRGLIRPVCDRTVRTKETTRPSLEITQDCLVPHAAAK